MRKIIFALVCALFISCSQSGIEQEIIGPQGGVVTSKDGRLRLVFPPGALTDATIIGVFKLETENLSPEFAALPAATGYLLMPEGLEFAVPVIVILTLKEAPLKNDGRVETETVILVTSNGVLLQRLDNLVQIADGRANETVISGELAHFSELAEVPVGVTASVANIPSFLSVGGVFEAEVSLFQSGELSGLFGITPPVSYLDSSVSPVLCSDCADDPALSAVMGQPGAFGGSFSYSCAGASQTGNYTARISFHLDDADDVLPFDQIIDIRLSKPVACGG